MAEAGEATLGLKAQEQLPNGGAGLEIGVSGKHRIPASAFEFKIPIPSLDAE